MTSPETSIPVSEWTDEEWIWALTTFPPTIPIEEVEKKVAERRRNPDG